jgi:hypothetical protein
MSVCMVERELRGITDGSLGPSRPHSGQQSQPGLAGRERRPSHR